MQGCEARGHRNRFGVFDTVPATRQPRASGPTGLVGGPRGPCAGVTPTGLTSLASGLAKGPSADVGARLRPTLGTGAVPLHPQAPKPREVHTAIAAAAVASGQPSP